MDASDLFSPLPPEWITEPHVGTAFLLGLAVGGIIGPPIVAPAKSLVSQMSDPPIPPKVVDALAVEIVRVLKRSIDDGAWG